MAFLILGLVGMCSLACLVCWIITLVKMFTESIGKGIFGLICGIYAFIWAWQNKSDLGPVPAIWTVALLAGIALRVVFVGLSQ